MLTRNLIGRGISCGLISGVLLAVFFKVVEKATNIKVYTLLLNVDYIPLIGSYSLPEFIEVGFHLIISVVLTIFILTIVEMKKISPKNILLFCILLNVFIGIFLFPTTVLSDKTPSITSVSAWAYWLIGHAIYGMILGYSFRRGK
jgi:ABC-type anion transport system duplicated permease subunit